MESSGVPFEIQRGDIIVTPIGRTGSAPIETSKSAEAKVNDNPGGTAGSISMQPGISTGNSPSGGMVATYPEGARLRGEEGVVVVLIGFDANGNIAKADLKESSGYPALDTSALAAVSSLLKPGIPAKVVRSTEKKFIFRLK